MPNKTNALCQERLYKNKKMHFDITFQTLIIYLKIVQSFTYSRYLLITAYCDNDAFLCVFIICYLKCGILLLDFR